MGAGLRPVGCLAWAQREGKAFRGSGIRETTLILVPSSKSISAQFKLDMKPRGAEGSQIKQTTRSSFAITAKEALQQHRSTTSLNMNILGVWWGDLGELSSQVNMRRLKAGVQLTLQFACGLLLLCVHLFRS